MAEVLFCRRRVGLGGCLLLLWLTQSIAPLDAASHHLPFCTNESEYLEGAWVPDNSAAVVPPFIAKTWTPSCDARMAKYNSSHIPPPYLRYRWMPKSCALLKFDKMVFCYALDGRSIGVAGDSMSQQFANTLKGMATGSPDLSEVVMNRPSSPSKIGTFSLCEGTPYSVRLHYLRLNRYPNPEDRDVLSRENHDTLTALFTMSDLLVLNWGVHPVEDDRMRKDVMKLSEQLKAAWGPTKPMSNVFWRSTLVYHHGCDGHEGDAPLTPQNASVVLSVDDYHGKQILRQERSVVWPALRSKGATLLRTDSFTKFRVDGHVVQGEAWENGGAIDCLHYCMPGPQVSWVDLFYNYATGVVRPGKTHHHHVLEEV